MNFYNGGRNARSLSSLFADPERILRRFYVFAEDPCKSTITTSEPCSPVFKEAQPRPSEQSISLISQIGIFMNFIIVHNVFLLLVIIVIKAIRPDCYKIKGSSVLLLETPLTRSKYISPYTHAQHLTRTSRTFYIFAYKLTLQALGLHKLNGTYQCTLIVLCNGHISMYNP